MKLDTIAFADFLLPYVENGEKTITIRNGNREYEDTLKVTDPLGDPARIRIQVTKQYRTLAYLIPEEDITLDGFLDLEDMVFQMNTFYPDFNPNSQVTVVHFKTTE